MSQSDNLNVVKHTYLAYRDRDIGALLNCLANDVKWFSIGPPDVIPTAGTRYGRDQVKEYFAALDGMEELESFKPQEFITEGDKVVVIGDIQRRIRSTGSLVKSPWIHVFTLQKGRITEFRSFYDTAAAIEALAGAQGRPTGTVRSETLRRSFL